MYRKSNVIRTTCCFWLVFFHSIIIVATEPYVFKSGLVLPLSHNYGRSTEYTDQLAYLLSKGKFETPASGKAVFTNRRGETISWSAIEADSENKFRSRNLGNGYLYLPYNSDKEQNALLHVSTHSMVYVNGVPRGGDIYSDGFLYLPVKLKKGLNDFLIRGGRFSSSNGIFAELVFDNTPVFINPNDPTLPIIVLGQKNSQKMGAIVVVNNTDKFQKGLQIRSNLSGKECTVTVPDIPPSSFRKVRFDIDASAISKKGESDVQLDLLDKGKIIHTEKVAISFVNVGEDYCETFISKIDGSIQYYAISPQISDGTNPPSLFLSVHGAAVEAINQARAYSSKSEGVLVAPTNRRPRGFNWEDWGRIDAMEVLEIAKKQFMPDPERIYLTGHSMGGHGTWYLGAHYAGQWAAIAPCAGYPTLAAYGSADGRIPMETNSNMDKLLLQASNPSNILEMAGNYNAGGVYIFHGDDDPVVSVNYARDMRNLLSQTTKDLSYYEYPGGNHWFGNESVDWKPLFDYFNWHTIPSNSKINRIDFTTANPAISANHYWISILQQQQALKYSRIKLLRSDDGKSIAGTTVNISLLSISLDKLKTGDVTKITLDEHEIAYTIKSDNDTLYLQHTSNGWKIGDKPTNDEKNNMRNGTFKEPFNNRMVYVYGTTGTKEENVWAFNKARYDAETWYYRGNGAVDIVTDKDFDPANYPDRGVILYGNASTNAAWKKMLNNCPIQATRGRIQVGDKTYTGFNLATYFMWPRADSKTAGIVVICGSDTEGMQAAYANQYFTGGSGFPDYMVFSSLIMLKGSEGVLDAGFYDNTWSMENAQRVKK